MAGGKKAKRGGTAEQRQALNASPLVQRNTAFIETAGGCERVFPCEVRDAIYRYLLLGRNVKKQRDSELWNEKRRADHYCFEVNILRANKAVYAEGKRRNSDPSLHLGSFADWDSQSDSKKSPVWRERVCCLVDQGSRNLLSGHGSCRSVCLSELLCRRPLHRAQPLHEV